MAEGRLNVPPHNIELEQSLLGGLMLDNSGWDHVSERVNEDDFYSGDHRLIFRSIAALAEEGKPFDVITLNSWLESRGEADSAGGLAYLGTLAKNTPGAANVRHYAEIVREHAILRSLISVSNRIAESAYHPDGRTVSEILDRAEQEVFEISEVGNRNQKGYLPLNELLTQAVERIDKLYQAKGGMVTGIPTGFDDFDKMTGGLQDSDLIIVAGRPAMGKTSFAMNIVEHAAYSEGKSVAVFNLEMSGEQLASRLISSRGRVDSMRVRTGQLDPGEWRYIITAVAQLNECRIFIDDTSDMTPTELRSRVRRIAREHGVDLVVIDYLQLMKGSGRAAMENRATEISEISRSLKAMAKELGVPVIALSQLNRQLENRPNKRPIMADLRESGAIEQDADLIVFIYRDEVYNEESADRGTAEVIIGKHRHGDTGKVRVKFSKEYTRFENLAPAYVEVPPAQGRE